MKRLNKVQTAIFAIGGALMVIGAGLYCFLIQQIVAGITFLVGSIMFGIMQCMQSYEGNSATLRRLKSIMNLADLAFIIAGIIMVDNALFNAYREQSYHGPLLFTSLFSDYNTYLDFIYNKWLPMMLIGTVLELYTTHRISSELKKEEQKQQK